jgi:cell division septation protein DedD
MTEDERELLPGSAAEIEPVQDPAAILKRRVYIGFAATMALGMAVAGAYITGRLFAKQASEHTPAIVASKITPKIAIAEAPKPAPAPMVVDKAPEVVEKTAAPPPEAPEVVEKVKPAPTPVVAQANQPPAVPDATVGELISPKHGEKYLQLAALGPHGTVKFDQELRASGFNPRVAPGPESSIYRIVVGPFPDQSSLEKQRDALEAAGIASMLRVY